MPQLNADQLIELMHRTFPQARAERIRIESVADGVVRFRYTTMYDDLRPGDTVAGPVLMGLSDLAVYLVILAAIGPVVLAVTTNLNINFLRKPSAGELVVETRLLKLGKRLAVGECTIYCEGLEGPASHATVTYSIPDQ